MTRKSHSSDEGLEMIGHVDSHFLDSGSFTLWMRAATWAKEQNAAHPGGPKVTQWDFYDTDEFWRYMRRYVKFVKKYSVGIDLYANVDVIPNAELSWRNLKWLEEQGLKPVPVVHYTTDLSWLKLHIKEGYDIIGLGGLVGSTSKDACRRWIDNAFNIVCDQPSRLPKVKIHGFGVTNYELMIRYPWYSVDSTSWTKIGAYGGILVPHKRKGKFVFDEQPYILKVSQDSPDRKKRHIHYMTMTPTAKKNVDEWLEEIDLPLGLDADGNEIGVGVATHHADRREANLRFFERMRKSIPPWPWPWRSERPKGFGIQAPAKKK